MTGSTPVMPMPVPAGYTAIPGGTFIPATGIQFPQTPVAPFGYKQSPVTNAEWRDVVEALGNDRYVVVDMQTGARASDVEVFPGNPFRTRKRDLTAVETGDAMVVGSKRLLKVVDHPSKMYHSGIEGRYYDHDWQPVVGVSLLHSWVWCALKGKLDPDYRYDLPTDLQFEYMARQLGAEGKAGSAFEALDWRLYIGLKTYRGVAWDEIGDGGHALKYDPFRHGNIFRWIDPRRTFESKYDCFLSCHTGLEIPGTGARLMSWRASLPDGVNPFKSSKFTGFQPVVSLRKPPVVERYAPLKPGPF